MAYEHLMVEKMDGGVGMITLNRPEVLNALNSALLSEYDEALIVPHPPGEDKLPILPQRLEHGA